MKTHDYHPAATPIVEARIKHYRWLKRRKFELFSWEHRFVDKVLQILGVQVPV